MNHGNDGTANLSRRQLGKRVGYAAAATALAGVAIPHVHAAEDSTIQIALVGCGGRGTGAAADALSVRGVRSKLVAMADVLKDRIEASHEGLTSQDLFGERVDVPPDRQFVGFDAYKKALDCLKPGDVAIFATPLAFRVPHFRYAIERGVHVFMEKPLTADGPTSRKLLELGEQASARNLKVGVGLMSRHAKPLQELNKRIMDGEIGDIMLMRGYRMHGPMASFRSTPRSTQKRQMSELEFQIRRFHGFLWASGGCFSDFNIHIIDHLSWMKNAWPVKAIGVGGRHHRSADDGTPYVDQNFDSYGVEYTFADGAKLVFEGRYMDGTPTVYHSVVQGTKGSAIASASGDCGAPSSIYKGWSQDPSSKLWESTDRSSPYQNEWNALMDAIVNDKPYSEVKRGVETSVVTSMGRRAAHTGLEVTYEQMLNDEHEFAPNVEELSFDRPAPLVADEKGLYPVPMPGKKQREW